MITKRIPKPGDLVAWRGQGAPVTVASVDMARNELRDTSLGRWNLHESTGDWEFYEPIPKPAPELCAFPGCGKEREADLPHGPCNEYCGPEYPSHECNGRTSRRCHDFVAPQAKAAKDIPSAVTSCAPGTSGKNTEAARGGEAAVFTGIDWCPARACELGPSAVAAAVARELWRPSVDELHWIPDAAEGWRR